MDASTQNDGPKIHVTSSFSPAAVTWTNSNIFSCINFSSSRPTNNNSNPDFSSSSSSPKNYGSIGGTTTIDNTYSSNNNFTNYVIIIIIIIINNTNNIPKETNAELFSRYVGDWATQTKEKGITEIQKGEIYT